MRRHIDKFLLVLCLSALFLSGCSPLGGGFQAKSGFREANDLFAQGKYESSLTKYGEIVEKYPAVGDRALFEMGIIYAHPGNDLADFQKALDSFQRITKDYPESRYRQDSELMIFYINNVSVKDKTISTQQTQLQGLRQELDAREEEIRRQQDQVGELQKKIEALERKVFEHTLRNGQADRILIEKNERRLTLLSKGEVLKSYRIALGGNPVGPKERQGDGKTPEGLYLIDAKNGSSRYHLSLHISYPNESDRKRARELGVSPGGDIMIHGIKDGFSWVGDAHSETDWTKGCIAVTDAEIEEIFKLAPIGTAVEIRP